MKTRRAARLLLLHLVLLSTGCAGVWRNWVEDPVYDRASEYVYARPIEEVWPEVIAFMERQGYAGRADHVTHRYISQWQELATGRISSTWRRYYVEGLALNPANCRIRIFEHDMFTGKERPTPDERISGMEMLFPKLNANESPILNDSLERAKQLEFELLRVLEPEAARAMYEQHKRRGLR